MIKHIVSWKVQDEAEGLDKNGIINRMKEMLEELPAKIEEIIEFEVGINYAESPRAFDICLLSTFESKEALGTYQQHPDHVIVAEFFKKVTAKGVVVDFEA